MSIPAPLCASPNPRWGAEFFLGPQNREKPWDSRGESFPPVPQKEKLAVLSHALMANSSSSRLILTPSS